MCDFFTFFLGRARKKVPPPTGGVRRNRPPRRRAVRSPGSERLSPHANGGAPRGGRGRAENDRATRRIPCQRVAGPPAPADGDRLPRREAATLRLCSVCVRPRRRSPNRTEATGKAGAPAAGAGQKRTSTRRQEASGQPTPVQQPAARRKKKATAQCRTQPFLKRNDRTPNDKIDGWSANSGTGCRRPGP